MLLVLKSGAEAAQTKDSCCLDIEPKMVEWTMDFVFVVEDLGACSCRLPAQYVIHE